MVGTSTHRLHSPLYTVSAEITYRNYVVGFEVSNVNFIHYIEQYKIVTKHTNRRVQKLYPTLVNLGRHALRPVAIVVELY